MPSIYICLTYFLQFFFAVFDISKVIFEFVKRRKCIGYVLFGFGISVLVVVFLFIIVTVFLAFHFF